MILEKKSLSVPENIKKLAKKLPSSLYIVGGFIRNWLLGVEAGDIDLAGAMTIDTLEEALKGTSYKIKVKNKSLGSCFIVCGEDKFEYTTFREDFYAEGGEYQPQEVKFVDDVKIDAKRRDFTCNALYYDIKNEKVLDFYGGIQDINNRILRTVESPEIVLSHDGMRILRMFRFMCELGFKLDKETYLIAKKYVSNLRDISGDKVVHEITSILHCHDNYPSLCKPNSYMRAFKILNKMNAWNYFGIDCQKIHFSMLKKVKHKSQGFLIDVIDTVKPISISYYLNLILQTLSLPKKMIENYVNILSGYYEALNRQQNKPYFFKYFDNFPNIYELLVHKSKYLANKYMFFYKYIIAHKLIVSIKDLKIDGNDLKEYYPTVKPERYKAILESLLSDIFDGRLNNDKKELISDVESKLKYL